MIDFEKLNDERLAGAIASLEQCKRAAFNKMEADIAYVEAQREQALRAAVDASPVAQLKADFKNWDTKLRKLILQYELHRIPRTDWARHFLQEGGKGVPDDLNEAIASRRVAFNCLSSAQKNLDYEMKEVHKKFDGLVEGCKLDLQPDITALEALVQSALKEKYSRIVLSQAEGGDGHE